MLKGSLAPVRKLAAGYGKYTDTSAADDIEAINATLSANSTSSSDVDIPKSNGSDSNYKLVHSAPDYAKEKIGGPPKVPLS